MRLAALSRVAIVSAGLTGLACSLASTQPAPTPTHRQRAAPRPAVPGAKIDGRLAPAATRTDGGERLGLNPLQDVETCETCHADITRQWRSSAHAASSFSNPVYRLSVDRFRERNGNPASRQCAGCHDPALLVEDAMDSAVQPSDPRAHAGVGCRTCHSVTHATPEGNGSYALTTSAIPLPEPDRPSTLRAHRSRVASPALRTAELCGACHRSFLGPATGHAAFLAGTDDLGPWRQSAFAGNGLRLDDDVQHADCGDCHMPREAAASDLAAKNGKVASHRFLGGHTWLASMAGDQEQLARTQSFLEGVVSIDVAATRRSGDSAFVSPEDTVTAAGETLELDVVLRNLSVAHQFPGGTRDAQAAWVDVQVVDGRGQVVAATTREDAHELRAFVADAHGTVLDAREVEAFHTVVVDHTIAPRDAVVVRHAWSVPTTLPRGPFEVRARLMHQSRSATLRDLTCAQAASERSQAFARAATGATLDPCAPQPATEIASVAVVLGQAREGGARPAWRRSYEHGLGLLHDVQEHAADARARLELARQQLGGSGGARQAAMIAGALAEVALRQGRFEEAEALAAQVRRAAPLHPAAAVLIGRAGAGAWRWRQAADSLQIASELAPGNARLWAELAVALNSTGDADAALDATARGLSLQPRGSSLLRSQALATTGDRHTVAAEIYDRNRPSDDAPHVRSRCATEARCARERVPLHLHRLQAPR
ncbi:MAG: multiheme c-type cytochrome [Myxococcota bacterium]